MRKRHYLKSAFIGGQLITGRHKKAIQNSLVMIDRGEILYAGERKADMEPLLKEFDFNNSVKLNPDELDKVSGGGGRCYPTNYRCPICDELLYVRPKI